MKCKVDKTKVYGKIVCPPNKSYTHRALFLAALSDGKSTIENVLLSRDTRATLDACKSFGVEIQEAGTNITLKNSISSQVPSSIIDAANSGTTIRIASAIATLLEGKTVLSGDESLKRRPMQPLLDALETLGAKCTSTDGHPPVTITGKIKGGEITIPGNISSQYVTALMITAPRTENGMTINIEGNLVSKPYVDATIYSMKKFGVNVETVTPYQKYIVPPKIYKPTTFSIPSDFSSLALLLSTSILLGDNLTVEVIMGDIPQGDEAFIDMLEILGVIVTLSKNIITVKSPKKLDGGKFDLENTPDLLPPLAILALKTTKPIEIYNVKHARYKETDRIAILAQELQKLGIKVDEKEDGLVLNAPDQLRGAELNPQNDHRLFMAFCIAGMFVGECSVLNPESVDVSYPNFISDMNKVGGKIKEVR